MKTKRNAGLWALGFGLLSLAIAGFLFFSFPNPTEEETFNPEDFFDASFSVYPNEVFSIEKNGSAPTLEQTAFLYYETYNFPAALLAFDSLLQVNPQDDYRFFQSIAQIATDRNSDAILNLSRIVENQQTQFQAQAEWYLALAYLKIGADDAAISILEKRAAEAGGFQSNRSKALLEMLQNTDS